MELLPVTGAFNLPWNKKLIHVPAFLNNVARHKPEAFWNWLTRVKYNGHTYINMTLEDLDEEEMYRRSKV